MTAWKPVGTSKSSQSQPSLGVRADDTLCTRLIHCKLPVEEHESAGDEERPDELRHEDPLAVRALLPHPPDVGVDGGHLGRHVGILAAQPLQRPLRLLLLVRVQ